MTIFLTSFLPKEDAERSVRVGGTAHREEVDGIGMLRMQEGLRAC